MDFSKLDDLQKRTFNYFQSYTNLDENSRGFGLSVDHSKRAEIASIASTGFFLSSLVIGVSQNYISYDKAYRQAYLTLKTLMYNVPNYHGFFFHFLDINTAERYKKNEVSTIDTALCLCGVATVASFFKGEIEILADQIMNRVDWKHFIFEKNDKTLLHMAFNPDIDGDYIKKDPGFIHQWDMFAEQLMMYLFVADRKPEKAVELYNGFDRMKAKYDQFEFIMTPGNTLFVYQFPLAWLDLKNVVDDQNISWFDNAKTATLVHQKCSLDYRDVYHTFSESFFGFTASDTPNGYRVFHGLPNAFNELKTDGTVSPCSALGSFPFTPEISYKAFLDMLKIDGLYGPFGFYDAFNLEGGKTWISERYYGINQGLILLMVDAVLNQSVYHAFMSHKSIIKGMEVLKWKRK
ncbi:MAG: hypothetical protein CVV58_01965 [Tenericutes bacterium HGW-Tenericutes-3]|nr:MAG: hypothetical protein CVV58_01965 [Tenericutes bacterium HGW-Tenericutes-3]